MISHDLAFIKVVFFLKKYVNLSHQGLIFVYALDSSLHIMVLLLWYILVKNRAQFHGSAYRKHSIGAYRSREFCACTARVFHGLAANFGFCVCVLRAPMHSRMVIVSAEFGGKQSHEIGPSCFTHLSRELKTIKGQLKFLVC